MRSILLAASLVALAACGQPTPQTNAAQALTTTPDGPPPSPLTAAQGWQTGVDGYLLLGQTLPAFEGKLGNGAPVSSEGLRDRWTILGLWPVSGAPAEEASFASALNSAVDQDPDLDLLIIHTRGAAGARAAHSWPAIEDNGAIASALNLPDGVGYLLIGPDLTVEAYRGALSSTPEDGIKPVIRGVGEIRKQVAAPG